MQDRLNAMISELPDIKITGSARDGRTAIKQIRAQHPDVVILDIRMPKKSGIDVLRSIKTQNGVPTVIVFTNYPFPQYRKKCVELGADFFLDKTTEFEKLDAIFKKLTNGAKKHLT